jgi:hypothetical protein
MNISERLHRLADGKHWIFGKDHQILSGWELIPNQHFFTRSV